MKLSLMDLAAIYGAASTAKHFDPITLILPSGTKVEIDNQNVTFAESEPVESEPTLNWKVEFVFDSSLDTHRRILLIKEIRRLSNKTLNEAKSLVDLSCLGWADLYGLAEGTARGLAEYVRGLGGTAGYYRVW